MNDGSWRNDVAFTSVDGVRPAIRAASTTEPAPTSADASLQEPNDGAHTGTTLQPIHRRRQRVRDLSALAQQLSERDWTALRSVAEHRFLTVRQIQALHFGELADASGLRSTQRVLARLRRERVLASLPQRIGGMRAGSSGLVQYVDEIGERLLRQDAGTTVRRRFQQPTRRFLDHQLGIADAHVALVQADRHRQLELLHCTIEPSAWRPYVGIGGARVTLKPDLYAETSSPPGSDYLDAAFIEIDMGTESIPTLIRKCREYETYRRQGIEQERNDGAFPWVIWSMTAETNTKADRRRSALREAIAKDRTLPSDGFRIIAPEQLVHLMQKGGES